MFEPFAEPIGDLSFLYAHTASVRQEHSRIYSLAAKRIGAGRSRAFSSLVRCDTYSARNRYRSNLSLDKLKNAPSAEHVRGELASFLDGVKIGLAFSQHSDLAALQRFSGLERMVDLSFAAEFFLQELSSHSFLYLWEVIMGKAHQTVSFSASEVVELSDALVRHICWTQLNDARQSAAGALRHYLQHSNTLFGRIFCHLTECHRDYFGGLLNPKSDGNTETWRIFLKPAGKRQKVQPPPDNFKPIDAATVQERFQQLATSGRGYKLRQVQLDYARHVTEAFNRAKVLCIEAGTGTGKTLGYLLPALEFLRRNPDQRIVVSTYTKNLQEQIVDRELATIQEELPIYRDIPVALLKGKASYVCAEKLDDRYEPALGGRFALAWIYLLNNLFKFPAADLDSVGASVRLHLNQDQALNHLINTVSARDGCLPTHRFCPAQFSTAEAMEARLVVTNHHKLALLERDPFLGRLFRTLVVDEANHFETAARAAFRIEANAREAALSLDYLADFFRKQNTAAEGPLSKAAQKGASAAEAAYRGLSTLRDGLMQSEPGLRLREERVLRPDAPAFGEGHLGPYLYDIRRNLGRLTDAAGALLSDDSARLLRIVERSRRKARTEIGLIRSFTEALGEVEKGLGEMNNVVSFTLFKKHFSLFAAPVMVSDIVRSRMLAEMDGVVFTAATLRNGRRFDCFREILGLDRPLDSPDTEGPPKPVTEICLASPFAPDAMQVFVFANAVSGRYDNKEAWLDRVSASLPELIFENRGRTLVLFSSYADLAAVAGRVADPIAEAGFPVLLQTPRTGAGTLCEEFRSTKESVLFGVETFWYGVDFKGDTLTQVIITRIPYPSPRDPVNAVRRKILSSEKFWQRCNYERDIKLRQGIGRLLRSEKDRGRVVILDSRFRKLPMARGLF